MMACVALEVIPATLNARPQFICWQLQERSGRPSKVPVNPHTGNAASTNSPDTWGTMAQARARCDSNRLSGIGYVFTAEDPFTGIDLDKCRDPESGAVKPWAQAIVEELDSYTEISPSGRGLHIIVQGKLPGGPRRKGAIEMYDRGRYFTMTGNHLAGTPTDILPRQTELSAVHAKHLGGVDRPTSKGHTRPVPLRSLSDHDLLQSASMAKNGGKFSLLWNGDWQGAYDSQSEADLALCNLLAFRAGNDPGRIDSLFRQSRLMRPKWDQKHFSDGGTYGEATIEKALAHITKSYGEASINRHARADAISGGKGNMAKRLQLRADSQDLPKLTAESWQAIKTANSPPRLFRFGGQPSRLEFTEEEHPVLKELTVDRLRYEVAGRAEWVRPSHRSNKEEAFLPGKPPLDLIRNMLACPEIPLPPLNRIVETPVFGQSGELLYSPGYHARDAVYYSPVPKLTVPAVSSNPSAAQIHEAVRFSLEEFLGDFPFVNDSGKAHALACLLLPFVRDLIDGPTPLHLIEKPTPRTGGTLLAAMLVLPAVGSRVTQITEAHDSDEWRKAITALLLGGPVAVCIDNIRRRLEAGSLATALTSTIWSDRILGHSEKVTVPARTVWLATGNNPTLSDEILGRTVFIRLDAHVDRPQDRTGFRHALPKWGLEHRGELIQAALTLCQGWVMAGRPKGTLSKGGFEEWSSVVGGILDYAEVPGFLCGNDPEFADPETEAWRAFISKWWEVFHEKPVGIRDVFTLTCPDDNSVNGDDFDLDLGEGSHKSQRITLGRHLMERRDRQFALPLGLHVQLVAAGYRQRARQWKLKLITAMHD